MVSTDGGVPIKTILLLLMLSGLLMAGLAFLRVPFAVRFWRKLYWIGWLYVAVVVLSAVRLWLSG
jgi:hypothetical protein